MSIFVNPRQFGAAEDLDRYPRTLGDDLALCAEEGVALVFAPRSGDVPGPQLITVDPGPVGQVLEGAVPARLLRRRADRGAQAVRADPAGRGGVRREGRPAAGPGPADVGRPRPRRRGRRRAHVPRPGRPGRLQPQPVPVRPRRTAPLLPAALRAGPEAGRAARRRCSRRPAPCSTRPPTRCSPRLSGPGRPPHVRARSPGYTREALLLVAARVGRTRLIDNRDPRVGEGGNCRSGLAAGDRRGQHQHGARRLRR